MKHSLCILLLVLSAFCLASELPFYAQWQSLNSMYYDTLQSGKELSWDEAYRAEFGLKRIVLGKMDTCLELETEPFGDEAQVRLKTFLIGYDADALYLQAGTDKHGYGSGFAMDRYPTGERGFEPYRYQGMRLNSLGLYRNLSEEFSLHLNLGGNKHNQASGLLALHYLALQPVEFEKLSTPSEGRGSFRLPTPAIKSYIKFQQDLRVMDNHWRTPVSISAVDLKQRWPRVRLDACIALALLPKWEATRAHHELFYQAELQYAPPHLPQMAVGTMYQKQNYAPYEVQQYQFRLSQSFGQFKISPLSNLHDVDGNQLWQHRLMAQYRLKSTPSTIGIYYDYSYFEAQNPRHSFGLALDFEFNAHHLDSWL